MTYKEFGENADITIELTAYVNGEIAYKADAFNSDYLLDLIRPMDNEIARTLAEQYELLPENYTENE